MPSSVSEMVRDVENVYSEIRKQQEQGVRESSRLDELMDAREGFEHDIHKALMAGERLDNALDDYCFRNFPLTSHYEHGKGKVYSKGVIEIRPLVKEFVNQIGTSVGQRVLEVYGDRPMILGIISGEAGFEVDGRQFRSLFVPVNPQYVFDGNALKWEEGKDNKVYADSDLFRHPAGIRIKGVVHTRWETDHSQLVYIGGSPPEETGIYVGTRTVNAILDRGFELTIPARKVVAPEAPEF